ncbi:p-hydroxycinnamoyl CoA hydratase/lyase [Leifsonia sp. Root112D2]|uniref:p-hydroxycinnamoyl CoA hydratase/lyase n=1 Tax=Leifsonia sp. Root112D2 TaxID=1736426 RepID=UPI0006F7F807|nr:p-hydroxycinnamoyl CoA hydratase/lyase [Leifsonia sp. Root112D2]KQV06442.1 naphthoate synthase [Leifsonia sp. Root112D2]
MTDPIFETIRIDREGLTSILTLNRPEKRNAMSPQLHIDMTEALEYLRYDDATRVLVITGTGESFCAGMDLKEFFLELRDDPNEYERITRLAVDWRGRTLRYFPKPTIAMVNGYCFGGAFAIVESCDIAVAASSATFGLSEINFNTFPGGAVSKALANLLRPRDALMLALTGRPFDGAHAAEIGLVTYTVPDEELRQNVLELAAELATKNSEALRATKEAYRFSLNMPWEEAMAYSEAREATVTIRTSDSWRDDGIGDFLKGEYKPGLNTRGRA